MVNHKWGIYLNRMSFRYTQFGIGIVYTPPEKYLYLSFLWLELAVGKTSKA